MLEVDDILPSPLTLFVLPHPVPGPVCEMQTLAPFTMALSSPQPKPVDTINYARVNQLPLPATSSSSSDQLQLISRVMRAHPRFLSDHQARHKSCSFKEINNCSSHLRSLQQKQTRQSSIHIHHPSRADEVAIAEQSGRNAPETVVPNHLPMIDRHQRTIIRAMPIHLEGALGSQHTRSTPCALRQFRVYSHPYDTLQALHEAHSPHPLAV